MKNNKKHSLFIFHRDLRLHDNSALIAALKYSEWVIPCFIFTPEQLEKNPYRSDHSVQFMIECLQDLDKQLLSLGSKLYLFYGHTEQVVEKLIDRFSITAVYSNRDYTPFARARDENLKKLCDRYDVELHVYDDALLIAPEASLKKDGTPYKVFTPYFANALKFPPPAHPLVNGWKNYFKEPIDFAVNESFYNTIILSPNQHLAVRGGRSEALKILKDIKDFAEYASNRDFPADNATTHLSAYLKFNVVSVRELYHAVKQSLGLQHALIRELYWRDFFTTIGFFYPHVFSGAFNERFNRIAWVADKKHFQAWCEGQTGFPIVDAGMRELNATGFMHNRVRMIVASFLTKDLHIDWRWGEQYFAQKLIDYDPAVNNGNWQWCAGTGCDAQPYFRIFNPWNQQKKFDADCAYIKKWIPELKDMPAKEIHRYYEKETRIFNYPRPLVDHAIESKNALLRYQYQ